MSYLQFFSVLSMYCLQVMLKPPDTPYSVVLLVLIIDDLHATVFVQGQSMSIVGLIISNGSDGVEEGGWCEGAVY